MEVKINISDEIFSKELEKCLDKHDPDIGMTVREAIQKQYPQKVTIVSTHKLQCPLIRWSCPKCQYTKESFMLPNYCPKCGQRLEFLEDFEDA